MRSNFLARFDLDWDNMPVGAFDHKVNFTDLTRLVVPCIRPEGNKFLRDHVLIETTKVGSFHIKIDSACGAAGVPRCEHARIRLI